MLEQYMTAEQAAIYGHSLSPLAWAILQLCAVQDSQGLAYRKISFFTPVPPEPGRAPPSCPSGARFGTLRTSYADNAAELEHYTNALARMNLIIKLESVECVHHWKAQSEQNHQVLLPSSVLHLPPL